MNSFGRSEECIRKENHFPNLPKPSIKDKLQLLKLLKLKKVEQRTPEWFALRKNMITASNWASCLGMNKYENKKKFILKKCGKSTFKGSEATQWGTKYEQVATRLYELRNKTEIYEFGVLEHPLYSFLGASPDGITPYGIMLEIKCPFGRKITGEVPEHYWAQMQAQLEVCNLTYCDYLECKIVEYHDPEEYFEDTQENPSEEKYNVSDELLEKYKNKDVFNKTKDGYEKGIVLTFTTRKGEYRYFYSELGVSKKEFEKWYEKIKKETSFIEKGISYWRFDTISCVRVDRDKKWFESVLPTLKGIWDDIQERKQGKGCSDLIKKNDREEEKEIDLHEINVLTNDHEGYDHDIFDNFEEESINLNYTPAVEKTEKTIDHEGYDDIDDVVTDETKKEVSTVKENVTVEIKKEVSNSTEYNFLECVYDLQIATRLLPEYMPLNPYVINKRSVEECKMSIVATNKVLSRCTSALSKMMKMDNTLIRKSEYMLENIVYRLNCWITGMPVFLGEFEQMVEIELTTELRDAIKNMNAICVRWRDKLFDKFEGIIKNT